MKTKFASCLIGAACLAAQSLAADLLAFGAVENRYLNFIAQTGKSYGTTEEFLKRKALWLETDTFIKGYPKSSFTMAHNKFSDWTPEEKKTVLGVVPIPKPPAPEKKVHKKQKLDAFWIFGSCEAQQYKSWLMGCKDCDVACNICEAKFFGGSDCLACKTKRFQLADGLCTCPDGIISEDGTDCCAANCDSCTSFASCTQCVDGFTKSGGKCVCNGPIRNGKCESCDANEYWDKKNCTQCSQLTPNCISCGNSKGTCTECSATYELKDDNSCGCPAGQTEVGNICKTLQSCPSGEYNDGNQVCLPCSENCLECSDVTAACTSCKDGFLRDQLDKTQCIACLNPVGPVEDDSEKVCVSSPYSATRIVPPYDADTVSVDWRDWKVVRPMQDQAGCGSCWSFANIANIESAYAIKTGDLYKLSEQHPVSCDTGNLGCMGGWMEVSAQYLADNGCIMEADYPYTSGQTGADGSCLSSGMTTHNLLTGSGYTWVDYGLDAHKAALLIQPLVIGFYVTDSFYSYSSGVYNPTDCDATYANHAMQAVGFGVQGGLPYAIIRNQWGTSWGDQGYMKVLLSDTDEGTCNLYTYSLQMTVGF